MFYKNAADQLMSTEVQTSPTFMVGQHRIPFSAAHNYSYALNPKHDVSVDHRRFVMLRSAMPESELVLVLNFFEELKVKVAT